MAESEKDRRDGPCLRYLIEGLLLIELFHLSLIGLAALINGRVCDISFSDP